MPKPIYTRINNFSGGIADDPRRATATEFQITKHFDIFSQPNRLIPYRSLETDTNDGSTATGMKQYKVRDFLYPTGSGKLYGLGQTVAGLTKIVQKSDATVVDWTLPASSEGNGAVWNGCFFEYIDYIWGFQGTNQVWKYGPLSGTPTITNSVATVGSTITSVSNGLIASDGYAYMAYNNIIVRITDAGAVSDLAIDLPTDVKITSLTNYGTYLAIGCSPKSIFNGKSKVFIWDLTSDLFAETINWGEGELRVLENIEGLLVGITDRYLNNLTGAGKGSMIIQGYSGGAVQVLKEIFTQALTGSTIPIQKVVKNNRLFWAAKIMTNTVGTTYDEGIWSFGRKNVNYPYSVTLDIIDENINASGIQSIGSAANYFYIAHSADGSIDKTDFHATYDFTSIYESQIYDLGDASITKELARCTVTTSPIIAGSVTVKYRIDDETSWTTIGSLSTVGSQSRDFINIESSGDTFPSFHEIQFRLESIGGVEITSYSFIAIPLSGLIES